MSQWVVITCDEKGAFVWFVDCAGNDVTGFIVQPEAQNTRNKNKIGRRFNIIHLFITGL
jgi:hypothetical protein